MPGAAGAGAGVGAGAAGAGGAPQLPPLNPYVGLGGQGMNPFMM